MRENSDGVCDRDAPRPHADSLCYWYNSIPPVPLNNSHLQLNLDLWIAQDVAGGGKAVRVWRLSITTQGWSPGPPDTIHPGDRRNEGLCLRLQPVVPSPDFPFTLAQSKGHTYSVRRLRSRVLDPREKNVTADPINPKPSFKEGKQFRLSKSVHFSRRILRLLCV